MPVPKKKHSKGRTRKKRFLKTQQKAVNTVTCKKCDAQKLPHRVCGACGN